MTLAVEACERLQITAEFTKWQYRSANALRLYCAIAEDWAETVLAGCDLSQCYPIPVEPSREFADMPLSRVKFLREAFVPRA
ncbi:hypothetical protein LJR225_002649 [Phenylobacterium sp. LjRoot225]|uniref:hypothetical protein n=1 Tax=Phenylobacterium sp. LjRoot225 TaxID=3342285 RepID=UPI003ED102DE